MRSWGQVSFHTVIHSTPTPYRCHITSYSQMTVELWQTCLILSAESLGYFLVSVAVCVSLQAVLKHATARPTIQAKRIPLRITKTHILHNRSWMSTNRARPLNDGMFLTLSDCHVFCIVLNAAGSKLKGPSLRAPWVAYNKASADKFRQTAVLGLIGLVVWYLCCAPFSQ